MPKLKYTFKVELDESEINISNCRGCRFDYDGHYCSLESEISYGDTNPKTHVCDPYTTIEEWCPLKKYRN